MPRAINLHGIRPYHTTISEDEHEIRVTLYRTVIAIRDKRTDTVTLNTGGYDTPTTIRRMNECLHHWGYEGRVSKSSFAHTDIITIRTKP